MQNTQSKSTGTSSIFPNESNGNGDNESFCASNIVISSDCVLISVAVCQSGDIKGLGLKYSFELKSIYRKRRYTRTVEALTIQRKS